MRHLTQLPEISTTAVAEMQHDLPPSRNPALVYIASLAPGSRRTMRTSLQTIVDIMMGYDPNAASENPNRNTGPDGSEDPIVAWDVFPWHKLEYQHTAAVRSVIVSHYKKRTAVKMLSALRRVLKECWRLGYISVETYHRAIDLERVAGEPLSQAETGRHIAQAEIAACLQACADNTMAGVRDAAVIALAYNCGLRRGEISGLAFEDLNSDDRSLYVRGSKGGKDRVLYIAPDALKYVHAWSRLRGPLPGALFGAISRFDKLRTVDEGSLAMVPHLTDQAIYDILKRRAKQANVETFSPHDLRRTFAGNLLDAGIDLATVQRLMGHADPATTAGYDRRSEQVKRDAIERLKMPVLSDIVDYTKPKRE